MLNKKPYHLLLDAHSKVELVGSCLFYLPSSVRLHECFPQVSEKSERNVPLRVAVRHAEYREAVLVDVVEVVAKNAKQQRIRKQ